MHSQYISPYHANAPVLEYVGVGRRLLAVFIDAIVLVIAIWGIGAAFHFDVIFRLSMPVISIDATRELVHMGPGAAIRLIIPLVYYIGMEAMLGATVGKMLLGVRVVKLDGTPIGWGESIIRNLLRFIDQLPFGIPYLLGAILVWTSPLKQRLGDRAAHTLVVRRRRS